MISGTNIKLSRNVCYVLEIYDWSLTVKETKNSGDKIWLNQK